jgi:hypothetical protein
VVTGVKNYKPHTRKNVELYTLNYLIWNLTVSHMSPPDKNVGVLKDLLGKSAFLVVKSCGANFDIVALEEICYVTVNSSGVILKYRGMSFFV